MPQLSEENANTIPTTVIMGQQQQQQPLNGTQEEAGQQELPSTVPENAVPDWDDDHSGKIDAIRDYTGMFEGPEKTLEVVFRRVVDEHLDLSMGEIYLDHSATPSRSTSTGTTASSSTSNSTSSSSSSSPEAGPPPTAPAVAGPVPPPQRSARNGLRRLTRPDLDRICRRASCTILSSVSNQYLDAYVLSESSLFIYPYMLVLKTCGTTTLLRCIATLIDLAKKLGLEIDWVGYSRKNFNFPGDQAFPHQSFHQELDYLYSHRNLCERLDGAGYTLGPVTGDHWFVFVADQTVRANSLEMDTDRVLNIMMFDIDERVAKLFYYDQYDTDVPGESKEDECKRISKQQTTKAGIDNLCPGAIIDPRAFSPCGYSMNAILFRSYSTIHITPESGSSYASFETNQKVASYKALISNVIRTFRPKKFVMTLLADEGGLRQVKDNPLQDAATHSKIVVSVGGVTNKNVNGSAAGAAAPAGAGTTPSSPNVVYKRSSLASIKVEEDCCCLMGNWTLETTVNNQERSTSYGNTNGSQSEQRPRGMTIS